MMTQVPRDTASLEAHFGIGFNVGLHSTLLFLSTAEVRRGTS